MNCPRCESAPLLELDRQGLTIDRCDRCRGVWLDRGELEKLIARETAAAAGADGRPREEQALAGEPPRRYRRADSDDGDDERRHHGKRRSSWWEIFD